MGDSYPPALPPPEPMGPDTGRCLQPCQNAGEAQALGKFLGLVREMGGETPGSQRTPGMANGRVQRLGSGKLLVAPTSLCVQGTLWRRGGA